MYSPKINEEFIPVLFKLSASKKMPIIKLVNEIIEDYLEEEKLDEAGSRLEEKESSK